MFESLETRIDRIAALSRQRGFAEAILAVAQYPTHRKSDKDLVENILAKLDEIYKKEIDA